MLVHLYPLDVEEKVFSVCGSQNFDEGLSSLQEKMSTAQE